MINLIIDAANEEIVFMIIADKQSYTSKHINSRKNFDKFMKILLKFLNIKTNRPQSGLKELQLNMFPKRVLLDCWKSV